MQAARVDCHMECHKGHNGSIATTNEQGFVDFVSFVVGTSLWPLWLNRLRALCGEGG